jgi:two-component system, NtrC family, response regulator
MKPKVLVVDDDEDIRSQMKWALCQDYEVLMAEDRLSAMETFRSQNPTVVLLDLGLPPRPGDPDEGLATLSGLLGLDSLAKVIIISGQSERQNALRAIGAGAHAFLTKPVEMEEVKVLLKRCFQVDGLEREYRKKQQVDTEENFEGMIGSSAPMKEVFGAIRKVASFNSWRKRHGQGNGRSGDPS